MQSKPPFDSHLVKILADILSGNLSHSILLDDSIDLEYLTYIARYWQVAPSLWLKIRDNSELPKKIQQTLKNSYISNTLQNANYRNNLCAILKELNAVGIEPVILKGGCQLFDPPSGNSGIRMMTDIDILSPIGQDKNTFEIIKSLGFMPSDDPLGVNHHHWPKLKQVSNGMMIEVHKRPWDKSGTLEIQAIFDSSIPIIFNGVKLRIPSVKHRLLHNTIHAFTSLELRNLLSKKLVLETMSIALHNPYQWSADELNQLIGSVELRQMLDFYELFEHKQREITWEELVIEAKQFDCLYELQQWTWIIQELFGLDVPSNIAVFHAVRPKIMNVYNNSINFVKLLIKSIGLKEMFRPIQKFF